MDPKILLVYFICISCVGIIMTVYDKIAAKHKKRRVRERTLLLVGLLGAALAMWITMRAIRHKTLHKKFMIGLPLECILHLAILAVYIYELPMLI